MTQPLPPIEPEKERRLNVIIAEYLKQKDAGRNVDKSRFLKENPEFADGLRSYFQGEAMLGENALLATHLSPVPLASGVRETLMPGAVQSDTASEFCGRKFGRYQILRPLGEGAMGSVYLALDTTLDRQVALKVPKSEGTANPEFMARFTREAKAAAGLKHTNICSVYDAGECDGTAYITMDYIDGVPLSRFIGSPKLQSVDSILQIISIIADAIGHAHSKGVIHRDLKPGNILVDEDFKPHVTDFGLARRAADPSNESRITQEGLLIGTPAYMSPEQVKGEQDKVGPRSDIYSLGVILFELLTFRLPFEGKVPEMLAKVLRDPPPVPSHVRKDLSEDVDDLCLKMLQKDPERRYASVSEAVAKIEALRAKLRATSVPSGNLTAQQKSPFEIRKAHIEQMLKKGQYAAAIQDLDKLSKETLPGAKPAAEWAKAKLPTVKKEAKALSPSGLEALLKTAQQMFQKSDYIGCTQLIEEIPPLRRTELMEDLLAKARRREADAEQLLSDIKDKERRQEIDGLEALVNNLLKLKPGNSYAKRLSEALQSYSKTPSAPRTYRYEKGRLQPMPELSLFRQYVVLAVLVGVLSFLSMSYYIVIYLKSGNQTLAVHVDDEWLKSQGGELTLLVDGDEHRITTSSAIGDPLLVVVKTGEREFSVKHGDTVVHNPRTFTIERDGKAVLQITPTEMELRDSSMPPNSPLGDIDSSIAGSVSQNRSPIDIGIERLASSSAPWISLFDGSDTSHWESLGAFEVENRLLVGRGKNIFAETRDEFADFELEAEWRLSPNERSRGGVFYRSARENQIGHGPEYQIIDDIAWEQIVRNEWKKDWRPEMATASLYAVEAVQSSVAKSVGEWNTTRIVCSGSVTEHWLNGQLVVRYDTNGKDWSGKLAQSRDSLDTNRITTARTGKILLQSQEGELAFRRIQVRRISSKSRDIKLVSDLDRVATGPWLPLIDSLTEFPQSGKIKYTDGLLELNHSYLNVSRISNPNIVIRADVRKLSGVNIGLHLRRSNAEPPASVFGGWNAYGGWYRGAAADGGDHFGIGRAGLPWIDIGDTHTGKPIAADEFVDLAFAAVGDRLTLYVNGEMVAEATDATFQQGIPALDCSVGSGQFRNARYQILDKASATIMPAGNDPKAAVRTRNGPTPAAGVAPFSEDRARELQNSWSRYDGVPVEFVDAVGIKMRLIPPGEFLMGAADDEPARHDGEGPQHKVRLTTPFFIGISEITQKQWFDVMGSRPWQFQPSVTEGDNYPASYVDWLGATEFCRQISERSGHRYRLPTEAEWEYACRAGTTTTWYFGNDVAGLDAHGWLDTNTLNNGKPSAQEVAPKKPNPFGLFDMHGNLFEWCQDCYVEDAYSHRAGSVVDPVVLSHNDLQETRITRGGGWDWNGYDMRSALRGSAVPSFRSNRDGFRVIRVIEKYAALTSTTDKSSDTVLPGSPAVAPFNAAKAKAYQDAWAAHLQLPAEYTNSAGIKFRLIPPGQFLMGSTSEQIEEAKAGPLDTTDGFRTGRLDSEAPQHQVTLSKPFYLGVTEVTQAQFEKVVGRQPSTYCKSGQRAESVGDSDRSNTPVEMVTWMDTGEFCGRLTIHEGLESAYIVTPEKISQTGIGGYRLPTEAEWEFACRAGTETQYSSGDHPSSLWDVAWTSWNSNQQPPKPVATRKANPFGLFDMHGNVSEWVHDGWAPDFYQRSVGPLAVDPRHDIPTDNIRIYRGGNFWVAPVECRSANRYAGLNGSIWIHTGFRVAISVDGVRQLIARNQN